MATIAPHCVITGAAQGIGLALADRFASASYRVVGIDVDAPRAQRAEDELRSRGLEVQFVAADLNAESQVHHLIKKLAAGPAIDVLIHNAGINELGRFVESDLGKQHRVLRVNLLAPMLITQQLLAQDKLSPRGSLVFVSSLSHFVGYPGASVYAASKDGLASYAASLRHALRPRKIHVLTVHPGPTQTEHARRHSPDNRREHRRMAPERLASLVFQAIIRRRRVLIPGTGNKIFALLGRVFPWLTETMLCRTILRKLPP